MESNALHETAFIQESIEIACDKKYEEGRKHHGPTWVGERGAVEAYDELIDALVYISLERQALFYGFDEEEDDMPKSMKTKADTLDQLANDIRGCLLGLQLFLRMTDGDDSWKRIFP